MKYIIVFRYDDDCVILQIDDVATMVLDEEENQVPGGRGADDLGVWQEDLGDQAQRPHSPPPGYFDTPGQRGRYPVGQQYRGPMGSPRAGRYNKKGARPHNSRPRGAVARQTNNRYPLQQPQNRSSSCEVQ